MLNINTLIFKYKTQIFYFFIIFNFNNNDSLLKGLKTTNTRTTTFVSPAEASNRNERKNNEENATYKPESLLIKTFGNLEAGLKMQGSAIKSEFDPLAIPC